MRCMEKIPNGKMVAIEVWASGGSLSKVKISGDFFLHPEDTIIKLEEELLCLSHSPSEASISVRLNEVLRKSDAKLIGVSTDDIARIFRKAME